ncbi:hypothetical protein BGW38_001005 [Lunasporangiospora selenospora]|uniref:Uncharacterized protein n=1 Tax=Lunasporangiospora selenospora TaxID=979761 RepID=A0A9P6KDU5_9FUNG|nr:hypothetical protein BGW38_001005 [Lunasporangiospora selenospora]
MTAAGIVTTNGYEKNVPGFGIATIKLIKTFPPEELVILVWQHPNLKAKLRELYTNKYHREQGKNLEFDPSQADLEDMISSSAPGFLITMMISDVGRTIEGPQTGKRGFKDSATVMELDAMHSRLQAMRKRGFKAADYDKWGYVHKGSIMTDGFRIYILAFKIKVI